VNVDRYVGGISDWQMQGFAREIRGDEGAADVLSAGGKAVDVRGANDFAAGHITGAVNVSSADLVDDPTGSLPGVAFGDRILVYGTGGASASEYEAVVALEEAGFWNVFYYSGGYADWTAAGR
jgi:rhodanese-related sulfurtransferase